MHQTPHMSGPLCYRGVVPSMGLRRIPVGRQHRSTVHLAGIIVPSAEVLLGFRQQSAATARTAACLDGGRLHHERARPRPALRCAGTHISPLAHGLVDLSNPPLRQGPQRRRDPRRSRPTRERPRPHPRPDDFTQRQRSVRLTQPVVKGRTSCLISKHPLGAAAAICNIEVNNAAYLQNLARKVMRDVS